MKIGFKLFFLIVNFFIIKLFCVNVNNSFESFVHDYLLNTNNLNNNDPSIVETSDYIILDNKEIILQANFIVNKHCIFTGNCRIIGNNKTLLLVQDAKFIVAQDAQLNLEDLNLDGLFGFKQDNFLLSNLYCSSQAGRITFKNVALGLKDDYIFNKGNIIIAENSFLKIFKNCVKNTVIFTLENANLILSGKDAGLEITSGVNFAYPKN